MPFKDPSLPKFSCFKQMDLLQIQALSRCRYISADICLHNLLKNSSSSDYGVQK